jgi:hypothetical protein
MTTTGLRCVTLLAVAARLGSAQSLEITPFVGLYAPAFELVNENAPFIGQLTVQHGSAIALGGRLGIPLSRRVTLEGIVSYAASGVEVRSSGYGNGSEDATVTVLGGQFAARVSGESSPFAFRVTAGAAAINHGGRYWKNFETAVRNDGYGVKGMSSLGVLLGAGAMFHIGTLPIRTGFDALIYDAKFTFTDNVSSGTTQPQLQADLHLFAGITLGGKR